MANTPWRRASILLDVDAGVRHSQSASVPSAPGAGFGMFWVRNDATTVPMFTDSGGGDTVLGVGGGGSTYVTQGTFSHGVVAFVDFNNSNSWEPGQATSNFVDIVGEVTGTAALQVITDGRLDMGDSGALSSVAMGAIPTISANAFAAPDGGAYLFWVKLDSSGAAVAHLYNSGGMSIRIEQAADGFSKIRVVLKTSGTDIDSVSNGGTEQGRFIPTDGLEWTMITVTAPSEVTGVAFSVYVNDLVISMGASGGTGAAVDDEGLDYFLMNSAVGGSNQADGLFERFAVLDYQPSAAEVADIWALTKPQFEPAPDAIRAQQPGIVLTDAEFHIDFNNSDSFVPNPPAGAASWDDIVYGRVGAIGLVAIVNGHANFNGTSSNVDFGTIGTGAARLGETPSFDSDGMQDPFGPTGAATGGSLNAWVRVETATSTDYIIDTGSAGTGFELRVRDEAVGFYTFQFVHSGTIAARFITTNNTFPIGSWVNIGLTWNGELGGGSVDQWYWNGQPISGAAPGVGSGDLVAGIVVRIGSNHAGSGSFFDGDIEMVTVWSEQQGDAVHLDIFNATAPRFGLATADNIYSADGTLDAARSVAFGSNDLTFSGAGDFIVNNTSKFLQDTPAVGEVPTATNADGSWTWQAAGVGGAVGGTSGVFYNGLQFYIDPNDPTSYDGADPLTTITDLRSSFTSAGTVTSVTLDDGNWNYGAAASRIDMGTLPAAVEDIYDGGGAGDTWIRVESDGGGNFGRIMDTTDSLLEGCIWFVRDEAGGFVKLAFQCNFTTDPGIWETATVIPIGQLTHVTVSYDADDVANNPTFWIDEVEYVVGDGITETSTPVGVRVSDSGNSLFVGNRSDLDRNFDGDIGPVRLWSRTLSVEESQSLLSLEGDRYEPGVYGINSYAAGRNGQDVIVHAGDMLADAFSGTAGDLLVRAGASTNANSNNPNAALTIRSGDGRTPTNVAGAGAPYAITISAGENNVDFTALGTTGKNSVLIKGGDIPVTVTQGNNSVHGGDVTIQGGDVIGIGGNNMRGGNIFILGGQNGGGATGIEGNVLMRSGSPYPGSGNSRSGAVSISTGYDTVAPHVQAGTGDISINTSENIGTSGFRSGSIEIRTGDTSNVANNLSGRIDIIAGNEEFRRASLGSPDVTIQAGTVLSDTGNRPAGSISLTAGDQLNTSFDNDSPGGSITMTAGDSIKLSSSSGGGAVSLTAGDHTLNNSAARGGNMALTSGDVISTVAGAIAGSVTITSGSCTGNTGTPGAISLVPGTDTGAGIGDIVLSYATWPSAEGSSGEVLTTDGAGALSWATSSGALTGAPGNVYENLQFYVDPADRNSFPATGGTDATDLEGNGTAGTLSAAAVFDNGAWTFNGASGDDVRFTKGATLDNLFAGGGTIITILRPYSSGQGTLGRAIDTTESTTTTGYYLSAADELTGHVRIQFNRNWTTTAGTWATDNITDAFGVSDRPLRLGDWAVVAVSYDDTATPPVVYLDGTVLAVTETSTPSVDGGSDAGNDVYIGNRSTGLFTWNGQIGTTLMFDRILTADEVQQVTNTFYARRGVGIRGYDSPSGVDPISGQTINIVAGDGIQADGTSDGGDVLIQAGDQTSASGGTAGEVIIRSGDQTTGTSFGDRGSRVLIESGVSSNGSGVTLRVGLQDNGNVTGDVLIHSGDNDGNGSIGAVLIRGGAPSGLQSTRAGGAMVVRGGDAGENGSTNNHGGAATFRGGEGIGNVGSGGATTVRGGDSAGNAGGGDLTLRSGGSGSQSAGDVTITASDAGSFGQGGNITVAAGTTTSNQVGGGMFFTTGNSPGNFTNYHAGDFTITTGNATGSATQPNSGAGSFYFTGGTSNAIATTSPGGEFIVTGGAGTASSTNSRGGAVSLTGGAVTGGSAATAGGVTLTGGAATVGTGGTVSLQPGVGPVAGSLILDYSTWPALDGTGGFILSTDGAGVLSWIAAGAGGSATAGQEGILYNGNTFYVDAGDRNSYPGTGTDFTDLINSTLGTMSGIGVIGGHFNFDGGTDVINFGVVVAAETEDIFDGGGTISFWVRPKSDGGTNVGRIIDTTGGTTTNGYFLRVDSESGTRVHLTLQAGHATTAGVWTVNAALEVGQWAHVVVTYSDDATTNDPTFYVNTLVDAIDTETTPVGAYGSDTGNTLFMGNSTATTEGWNGDIDVAVFLDRAISADEVQQLYRVQQSRFRPSLLGPRLSSGLTNAVGTRIEISGADGVGSGEGADVSISTGDADTTGTGGDFVVGAGNGGSVSGTGGLILMVAGGAGNAAGSAGTSLLQGGPGTIASVAGGSSTLQGGEGSTTGGGGTAKIQGGTPGTSGAGGSVQVLAVSGGATSGSGGSIIGTAGGAPSATAANAGNITFTAGSATNGGGSGDGGNVSLQPGTAAGSGSAGSLILDYSTYPAVEGAVDQFLQTDGAGALSWASAVANSTAWSEETATTTDATVDVTIATPIAVVTDGTQHSVEVLITAKSGGANTYFRRQVFTYYRDGGGAVQWTSEINGAEARRGLAVTVTAALATSGNAVLVQVTGQAATTINWTAQYRTTNTIQNGGTVSTTGIVRETFDNRGAPLVTASAPGSGDVDFTIAAGAAYVTMQYLRVKNASGTCADATIQFFYDAARTISVGEIYDAENKDTSTTNGWVDRTPATLMGNDGSGLESNLLYGTISNNDAGAATFDIECVLWGVT